VISKGCEAQNFPSNSGSAGFGEIERGSGAARRLRDSFAVLSDFKGLQGEIFPFDFAAGRCADSEILSRFWAISSGCEAENFPSTSERAGSGEI
jgi:hypothetical protein